MSRRPPFAAACDDVPLEQLAATAKMLADELVAAAQRSSGAPKRRPRLQLVGANDGQEGGDAGLSMRTRCYLRARRLRESLFPEPIFADPAWDILLELYACKLEGTRVCVSNACIAAQVPHTTALRWLDRLEEFGLIERCPDPTDSRRIYVELTEIATWRIHLWLKATFHADSPA